MPPGASWIAAPNPVAYVDSDGVGQIQVFALADNGHLVLNAWYGFSWTWSDLGVPPSGGRPIGSHPEPISWVGNGIEGVFVFLTTDDGRLFADAWDSNYWQWTWFDLGLGMGTEPVRNPTPISYVDASGVMNIEVFAEGSNGQLLVDIWDGTSWTWYDLGKP